LRFAFYGRVSTEDWQDPESSRARQREQAKAIVRGHGQVVTEFFDEGESRMAAWGRRPEAARLLAQLADPGRGWDAIVVGEYERAFYGSQYSMTAPLLEHYGVQLWMPEAGGRVDFSSEHDEQAMTALGLSSKREVTRTSIRVRTAMAVQVREQGRYLGGRPPYGYRLGDAGPHPNKAHAAWGRRAHRLEPDPETAHVVRWVFAQRLAGHSTARIARALNEAEIPCPSAADPKRNPHRPGTGWTLGTVAAILANPRYTGHQVWNRQRTDKGLADPGDVSLGHKSVQRWNLPDGWVISRQPAPGPGQRRRLHRGPGCQRHPRPRAARRDETAGKAALPAGRDHRLRHVRPANGIGVVQRQGGLPLPARPHDRQRAYPWPAEERLRPQDRILPHLPALHLLLTGSAQGIRRRRTRRGADVRHHGAEDVIGYLREQEITSPTIRPPTPCEQEPAGPPGPSP
jgi:DNA invertase Pin-like site-specific DNA recombinase